MVSKISLMMLITSMMMYCDKQVNTVETAFNSEIISEDGRIYTIGSTEPFTGTVIDTFANGNMKLKINFKRGKTHGITYSWHENGNPQAERTFWSGVPNGESRSYYEDGSLKSEAVFKRGRASGLILNYYPDGSKMTEGHMDKGKSVGIWKQWNADGSLKDSVDHGERKKVSLKDKMYKKSKS